MYCLRRLLRSVCGLAALFVCDAAMCRGAEPTARAEPFAYLCDAPQASAVPLTEEGLSKKSGWSRLEEDDTAHRFAGCAVMANDKIVAVLRKDSPALTSTPGKRRG